MKIFYSRFRVSPSEKNEYYDLVQGLICHCWIRDTNPQSAYAIALFFISRYDWIINEIQEYSVEVNEESFTGKDIGLSNYQKAKSEGISIAYIGLSRDGKATAGPIQIKNPFSFCVSEYIDEYKMFFQRGRCLHYDNGDRCDEIIKAHSIQRRRSLSAIAKNSHVYQINDSIGALIKKQGRITFKKNSIYKASTFLGFCKKHDKELFEPIDDYPLKPTDQQVLLYSYRSLCRELFVSENALEFVRNQLENLVNQDAIKSMYSRYVIGKSFGLENLKRHKLYYDETLKNKSFSNIRYVIFKSQQQPIIAFSGLFYPDFDFLGRELQNLADQTKELQLITFCSAPTENGWAYIFAWHETSSTVCVEFMRSLATMIHHNKNSLGDYLFRLVMTNCENLAISPNWWDNLDEKTKEIITDKVASTANIFSFPEQSYLMSELEGVSNWKFENVISNMY